MSSEAAQTIEKLLLSLHRPAQGALGTALGVIILLFGATSVFNELQLSLDRIWHVPDRPVPRGLLQLLRTRLLSFALILGLAFLLILSLVAGTTMVALGKWWGDGWGEWAAVVQRVNNLISLFVTTIGFAFIYKFMPRAKIEWRDVWLGAVFTAALFTLGRFLIGLYLGRSGVASSFGAAGSLIVVLVWVYYSAQTFLLGAEFTWIFANTYGSRKPLTPDVTERPAVSAEMQVSEAKE
jgi:membrane protein